MKKTFLLSIIPLLSITILAANLLGDTSTASAIPGQDVGVNDQIKMGGKGSGQCVGSSEDSGNTKANVRFVLLVEESEDGNYSGVAKSEIKGIKSPCDGIPKELRNNGPLLFSYDANGNQMTISGELKDKDDRMFLLEQQGTFTVIEKEKITMDMDVQILGHDGGLFYKITDVTVSWDDTCRHCTNVD